ncbi:MAG: hypothetical protein V1701_12935 [Planctomycetota bacterium]
MRLLSILLILFYIPFVLTDCIVFADPDVHRDVAGQEVIDNPESDEPTPATDSIRLGPLMTGGNNLFHSLILIPPLESAQLINPGKGYISAGVNYDNSHFSKQSSGWILDYDGRLIEGFLDVRYGVSAELETRATVTGGTLFENERSLVLAKNGIPCLSGNRGIGPSDLIVGIKYNLTEPGLGLSETPSKNALKISLKLPLADKNDLLSSGGIDLAMAYLGDYRLDDTTCAHYQIGYTITGNQNVFDHRVDLDNSFFYGAGISWLVIEDTAIIAQIEGNTTAYDSIKVLKANPMTIHGGFRYSEDGILFTEGSIGFGLNDSSSGLILMFSAGTMF